LADLIFPAHFRNSPTDRFIFILLQTLHEGAQLPLTYPFPESFLSMPPAGSKPQ
jgi:hypothetical protein